jgi:hypothetical protein
MCKKISEHKEKIKNGNYSMHLSSYTTFNWKYILSEHLITFDDRLQINKLEI